VSREAIAAANARLEQAFACRDAAAATAAYLPDGKLMAPFAEPYVGHAAIRAFLEAGFARGIAKLELQTIELEVLGDTAWEEGLFAVADAAGTVLDRGKYIVIWKKVGETWLMARDIMSSNLPQA
jgi:ketosteroid isomerase-like protein